MVDVSEKMKLAERCEKATGPDRELDWQISDALGQIPEHTVREVGFDYVWYRRPNEFCLWKAKDSEGRNVALWQPRQVTASIDAAMMLVDLSSESNWGERVSVSLWDTNGVHPEHVRASAWVLGAARVYAATPALALCAAALRAIAAMGEGDVR